MKIKYYLRGLGTGILFATLVLFIAYSFRYSDSKIREYAREMGMVDSSEIEEQPTSEKHTEEKNTTEKNTTEKATTEKTSKEDKTEDSTTEDVTEEPTEEITEEQAEEPTEEPTEEQTEEPTEEIVTDNTTYTEVNFTIYSGYTSEMVANLLAEVGVIDDAAAFNAYLSSNGYDSRITTGDYTVRVGDSFETIAELITN